MMLKELFAEIENRIDIPPLKPLKKIYDSIAEELVTLEARITELEAMAEALCAPVSPSALPPDAPFVPEVKVEEVKAVLDHA